ncbi:hypothetical protein K1T71_011797 [Dendrolimus kikuchii]|uniref:Uncharacterized protein n=1 Tax=Dendrolimus kikuchii TaxID=765133 RepID=A0ACC1CM39_9NEOP|nr:hypothetical protein K1T71_011797 [Dendrolimus kikuchii]
MFLKCLLLLTSMGSIFGAVINTSHERDDSKSKLMNHPLEINERTEKYTEIITHAPKAVEYNDIKEHHDVSKKLEEIFNVMKGIAKVKYNKEDLERIMQALRDLVKLVFGPFSEVLVPTISGMILIAVKSLA